MKKNIILIFLFTIVIIFLFYSFSGKNGLYCDGISCNEKCSCKNGGKCQNGKCCYPNCKGLSCGDDGCGGICSSCDAIPNGRCVKNKQCEKDSTNNNICESKNICCYSQDCNNVYCGPDGCGNNCTCLPGSTCSSATGPGLCVNPGVSGWVYKVYDSNSIQSTNVNSSSECAAWMPKNIILNLQNFPCQTDSDCPYLQNCVADSNGNKFCNRNNIFQYWYYDPVDPSGNNCTKILSGANVCGIEKSGAVGFDVINNVGPDKNQCGINCNINPICPPSGKDSCCPQDWTNLGKTSYCIDSTNRKRCCLDNPDLSGYDQCIKDGYIDCNNIPNNWWKGNTAEINNICDTGVTGNISVNKNNLNNFNSACVGKNESDQCYYFQDENNFYNGICRNCFDGKLRCFPERTCIANFNSSGSGTCSSKNICSG